MGTPAEVSRLHAPEGPRFHSQTVPRTGHAVRRILVCLDRSPFSEASLPYAVAVAKTLGSDITLLHVMPPRQEHPGLQATDALEWEIARQEAIAYLERTEARVAKELGREVDVRLDQGHPAERIDVIARELGADLTLLGSHGERGMTAWHHGSTVQQVLTVARGSVLVARSSSSCPLSVSPTRILVPLDGSLRSESVLPTASRLATAHDAELLLVLVVPEPTATALLDAPEDLDLARELARRLEARADRYLERLRLQLARDGVTVRTRVVRHPDPRQSLLEIAQAELSDLIVLSAHGSACNPGLRFGSVTAHLVAHGTVPLLVLQDLQGEPGEQTPSDLRAPPLRSSFPAAGES